MKQQDSEFIPSSCCKNPGRSSKISPYKEMLLKLGVERGRGQLGIRGRKQGRRLTSQESSNSSNISRYPGRVHRDAM
jgi:hypothetical protein